MTESDFLNLSREELKEFYHTRYLPCVRDSNLLCCLYAKGVDNWEYYDDAMELYEEEFDG